MKKVFTLLILCCVLFLSFKKNEMKSVNLSKDCKIEYVLASDGKKVLGMDIINGNSLIQVSFSEEDDDYSLSIENDGNISCRMIASPERLYSYSIQDKKNDFENSVNLLEYGDILFSIRTSCYNEVTNGYVKTDNLGKVEKEVIFDGKEGYRLNLYSGGQYDCEYTDNLYKHSYVPQDE